MIIRPLTSSERADWQPLWQGYLAFYKTVLPPEIYDTTFVRLTGGTEPMGAFIGFDDAGKAQGLVHWIEHRSCWTLGNYIYLQDLFVTEDARGTGMGRKLIEAVYTKARERNCARVHWLTHETNTDAMQLYDRIAEKSGFVQYRKVL